MKDEKRYVTAGVCAQAKYDEPQMATAMDNSMHTLAEALSELNARVGSLVARLEPVLIPPDEQASREKGMKLGASPLRARVDSEATRVYDLIEVVSDTIDRLEI